MLSDSPNALLLPASGLILPHRLIEGVAIPLNLHRICTLVPDAVLMFLDLVLLLTASPRILTASPGLILKDKLHLAEMPRISLIHCIMRNLKSL